MESPFQQAMEKLQIHSSCLDMFQKNPSYWSMVPGRVVREVISPLNQVLMHETPRHSLGPRGAKLLSLSHWGKFLSHMT